MFDEIHAKLYEWFHTLNHKDDWVLRGDSQWAHYELSGAKFGAGINIRLKTPDEAVAVNHDIPLAPTRQIDYDKDQSAWVYKLELPLPTDIQKYHQVHYKGHPPLPGRWIYPYFDANLKLPNMYLLSIFEDIQTVEKWQHEYGLPFID